MKPFIELAAKELWEAERNNQPISPLTETYSGFTVEDAYAVQQQVKAWKVEAGARLIGRKIGLTSKAMQNALGVPEPDFGSLYDNMLLPEGTTIPFEQFLQPKVEAELAFIMKEDLQGPGVHFQDVIRATSFIVPAFEIIDSRVRDWKIKIQDTIADNASSGALVLGSRGVFVDELNLRLVGLVLESNGQVVDTAAGAAVLGHPAAAVAWLCNKLAEFGEGLQAGDIVLSGSFTKAYEVKPGSVFSAHFDQIGTVQIGFESK
ncbi:MULTISPECIES: 2-keto-4-pentenoate hydratase [Aneurinibacillus]|jgi:2-keto-4-pentenoate hydratase|uniref:2-keto-4-pentenoate hydratase n=1 Tax=Aneurinibacillus danicus TaxID=267746 RepID=A0A511V316_9BACL|nr:MULTISPECIES: fumarylacetoacetate hydrolase family protein [Aneurinibacillus]GEN33259.1 2-keto-4-pentenoate hydratase [Aneurinibacillus danicus]